jgi:hypothetical protein
MRQGTTVWQADWDKPHRCPACHAVVCQAGFRAGITYACGTCETRFRRGPFLQPYQPGEAIWPWQACLHGYLISTWDLQVTQRRKLRGMRAPQPWWYVRGERGPLVRGAARAWRHASSWLGKIPGFNDMTGRICKEDAGKFYAETGTGADNDKSEEPEA